MLLVMEVGMQKNTAKIGNYLHSKKFMAAHIASVVILLMIYAVCCKFYS